MRKKHEEEGGGDSWLNTYADMVTLLLTFFVLLLSMSTVSQEKFNAFIRSFSGLPPDVIEEMIENPGTDTAEEGEIVLPEGELSAMNELFTLLSDYVEKNGKADSVALSLVDDVIYIRFDSAVFFEPDRYVLRKGSNEILAFIGNALKQYESHIKLATIFGHTATTSRTNSPVSDWMLSGERAAVVATFLEDEVGFNSEKLVVLGYGNNFPVADNSTEEGRRENRRVELAIIGKNSSNNFDPYSALDVLYNKQDSLQKGPYTSQKPDVAQNSSTGEETSPYADQQP